MLTQNRLQEAFYAIYDPEIAASLDLFCEFKKADKKYVKSVRRFASTYLLDKLELNTKSRCVFCWSGKPSQALFSLSCPHALLLT